VTVESWRTPWSAIAAVWFRHRDLLSNASSLLATTGITSALGFVYWTLAAREFSQEAVGYGSAAVSAMTLLGTVGMLGLGTLLIGELPRRSGRAGLVSAALLACGLGSLVIGMVFVGVAPHVNARFGIIVGTPARATLFAAGVMLTGVAMVFDQATIGLMRGGLQLWRNSILAIIKLLLLPATAVILHDKFGVGIILSWVVGTALSLALIAIRLRFTGTSVVHRPDWGVLRGLGRTAMAHNWLNLAITMPVSLTPVLVTVIVSPSANAAFYVATMIINFLFIVPSHLATVLFAVVAGEPSVVARKLRFALRLSYLVGLPGMACLILGSHLILSIFGKGYAADAAVPMCLLTLSYPSTVPKALYIAVCRAEGKIARAAVVLTACSSLEVIAAAVGGAEGALKGLAVALLAVRLAEAIVTGPPVVRTAFGHGRHRRTEFAATATANSRRNVGLDGSTPRRTETTKKNEQEAGLTALMMLAARVDATGPLPAVLPEMYDPTLRTPPRLVERSGNRAVVAQASDSSQDDL
jgi:O-antigen/teichoic acid export membrane protein